MMLQVHASNLGPEIFQLQNQAQRFEQLSSCNLQALQHWEPPQHQNATRGLSLLGTTSKPMIMPEAFGLIRLRPAVWQFQA